MSAYPLHGHDDDVVGTAPLAGLFPGSKFEQPRKTISNTQCQYQILSVTRASQVRTRRGAALRVARRAHLRPLDLRARRRPRARRRRLGVCALAQLTEHDRTNSIRRKGKIESRENSNLTRVG